MTGRATTFALIIGALAVAAGSGVARAVETPVGIPQCTDAQDAFLSAVVGRRLIQGEPVQLSVQLKAEHVGVPVSELAVSAVGGGRVDLVPPSTAGATSAQDLVLPEQRNIVLIFSWLQGPAPSSGAACAAADRYVGRAFVNRRRLGRYLAQMRRVQGVWERGRSAYSLCVDPLVPSDFSAYLPVARCLDAARLSDRSLRRYRAVTPLPGLRAEHLGLVQSAAIRAHTASVAASFLRRAVVAVRRGEFLPDPEFPPGLQKRRAEWQKAIRKEMKALGMTPPAWIGAVGVTDCCGK